MTGRMERSTRWSFTLAGSATVILLVCLAGWLSGNPGIAGFSSKYIMMAPSTLLVLFLDCLSLFLVLSKAAESGWKRILWLVPLGIGGLICLEILASHLLGVSSRVERLLTGDPGTLAGIPMGRMSPVAAVLLLLSAASLLLSAAGRRQRNRTSSELAVLLSGTEAFFSLLLVLAYAYGVPMFYSGNFVPPAVTTAICLTLLNAAILLSVSTESRWIHLLIGDSITSQIVRGVLPAVILLLLAEGWVDARVSLRALNPAFEQMLVTILLCVIIVIFATAQAFRINRRIERSETVLKSLSESTSDAIYVKDREGRYVMANRATGGVLGMNPERVLGRDDTAFFPPSDARLIREGDRKVMDSGEISTYEEEITIPGGIRTFLSTKGPVRDAKGKVTGLFGIARDITERKVAESNLRASEERFRTLIEQAGDGFELLDSEGRYVDVNNAACVMTGYSRGELLGKSISEIDPGKDLARFVSEFRVLVGSPAMTYESTHRRKDGSIFPVEVTAPIIESRGTRLAMTTVRDITERKRSADALRESEEKYRNLFDNAEIGMFRTRSDGSRILDFNAKYLEIFGRTREEMLGSPTLDYWADAAERAEMIRLLNEHGAVENFNCRMIHKSGQIRDCLTSVRLYPEAGVLEGSIIDITDRKRMEKEIRDAQRLESLGQLAGGIAHDFNNLLSIIYGNLQLIEGTPGDSESLSACLKTLGRAKAITSQLLTFAKGGTPVKKTGHLAVFLRETVSFALSGSKCRPVFEIDPELWSIDYDEGQIGQVFDNLVINASQAMPGGGVISITAENLQLKPGQPQGPDGGSFVRVSFKDEGTGMPPNVLERLFDPYFTTKETGRGLGLASSYSIVRNHGGWIEVESEPGKGSLFRVHLPASRKPVASERAKRSPVPLTSGRFLIMDDEEDLIKVIVKTLESLGCTAVGVRDGKAALELLKSSATIDDPFTAVVLDLTVPGGMGGLETAKEIRKAFPDLALFVASGYSDDPVMADPEKYGFNGSLNKPFNPDDLAEMLNRAGKK